MFDRLHQILRKVELDEDKKDVQFEKNDFLAIMMALSSYMVPVLIGFFLFIAVIVWLLF
ncbi:MAG: hypothetical protein ABIJ86_17815 [Spirochaetota bacterium]